MDSLWVDFWVYDSNRNKIPIKSIKLDSLLIDSILIPDVKFSTDGLPGGLNGLWIEANPFNSEHQLEQYHFNNIGTIPFNVGMDAINPLMDVTFDGVHIMNGDIVSAKPSVIIKLKDENTFLALNDPSDFEIRLKRPGKTTYDTISFGSTMTFDPATLPNNSCKINYIPTLADGTYHLKVQAKDRTKNASGNVEYTISFEVINKPTVTNVLNYPNPFSTSTRFVFTLTGSAVPDYFKIQILTITGKIVRDFNKYELGPLHIGRNITEYAWDGKDEFGDQLANGLYLYRVITQLDGKSLEHRDSGADLFFTRGYGKMYLIR
ncbi:MAG: transporter, partial [Bacteroidota bacterium]